MQAQDSCKRSFQSMQGVNEVPKMNPADDRVIQGDNVVKVGANASANANANSQVFSNARMICSLLKDNRSQIPQGFHPHDFLQKVLQKRGMRVEVKSFEEIREFFSAPTEEEIASYKFDVLNAVRSGDIETLRRLHSEGRPLKCSNQFGESLLHLACRKQLTDVVRFLFEEGDVPPNVCDDYGRTPLHDACWTPSPNFELVDVLISRCPDLLYIKDKRGHTPLFYARREHWIDWIKHLAMRADLLCPRALPHEKL
jgi:Ankyrin repeats (3 copies)